MDAKQFIKEKDAISTLHYDNYIQEDVVIKLMNQFAVHISEQVASELIQGTEWVDIDSLDRLITRIKTLTEQQ